MPAQTAKRYAVTGASSGIGFATALHLAQLGHWVIAIGRNNKELTRLQSIGGEKIHIISADLATDNGLDFVISAIEDLGPVNGIVHAAGSRIAPNDLASIDTDQLLHDTRVHVAVPISINNALRGCLTDARIVYIDSYSASSLRVGWGGYSIVKAAAQMAARVAAEEFNCAKIIRIFPGAVRTPLVEGILNSDQRSPTVNLFNELKADGKLAEPSVIGKYIAGILTIATDEQLTQRDYWDVSRAEDNIF